MRLKLKKKVNKIELKGSYSFIFKVYGPIKVSTRDEFQFWIKVQELKTYLTQYFIT